MHGVCWAPGYSVEHADILAALAMLRAEQREALILVEATRFSFGEAASRFRSLVEGARADLARHLERQQGERPNQKGVPLGFLPTA
jgi:DNA-directed RNA polymerase specialized sigma24 family protein